MLGDTRMRTETGASIVAVLRRAEAIPSPAPDFRLAGGDTLIVDRHPRGRGRGRGDPRAGVNAMHSAVLLIEFGAIILGLGLLGRFAGPFPASRPIPLYLLAGLAFGEGGLLPLGASEEFVAIGAEIGVILLLLMLGLEYTASDLVTNLKTQYPAGLVDVALNAAARRVMPRCCWAGARWPPWCWPGVTWISSSGVIAKVLGDLGRLGNRETPVILSVLVLEDLAMAVYLPIVTALLAGVGLRGGQRRPWRSRSAPSGSVLFVARALRPAHLPLRLQRRPGEAAAGRARPDPAGRRASPSSSRSPPPSARSWSASRCPARSPRARTRLLSPLRDLFAAVFFVFFGLHTDPASIPPVLLPALALAVVTALHEDRHRLLGRAAGRDRRSRAAGGRAARWSPAASSPSSSPDSRSPPASSRRSARWPRRTS